MECVEQRVERGMVHGAILLSFLVMAGCSGERGATITGRFEEDGQPLQLADKEHVYLSLIPVSKDDKSSRANPGADVNRDDGTFKFIGPGQGLVPAGEYKIAIAIRPREAPDRLAGQFTEANTPLRYTVTDEPNQELVIDLVKKTVSRKHP
jgi:hypothetical protein